MLADDISFYITSLRTFSRLRPSTIDAYAADLEKLAVFADDTGVTHSEEMDEIFLSDFLLNLKNQGASKSGVRRTVACLHGFFSSLVEEGKLAVDPSRTLSGASDSEGAREKEKVIPLTKAEKEALTSVPAGDSVLEKRDRALLLLLLSTGLRTSEVQGIRIRDIDFLVDFVTVHTVQGSERSVPFSEKAEEALREYIGAGRDIFLSRNDYLFLNRDRKPLSRTGIWKTVRKAGETAGIRGGVTPARIRATVEEELAQSAASGEKAAAILGKKSMKKKTQKVKKSGGRS